MPSGAAPAPKTREQVRREFDARGVNVAAFARDHGLDETVVYQVLGGHKKGRRGEAHRAAVVLGLKVGVATPPPPEASTSLQPPAQSKTVEQVRQEFERSGQSIEDWARLHGFRDPNVVHKLLSGHGKGLRGESRRAAVLLGLDVRCAMGRR